MKLQGLHKLYVEDTKFLDNKVLAEETPTSTPMSKALADSGESQAQIAKDVGVHPSTISRYKHKEAARKKGRGRRPSFDTLKRLSQVVGRKATVLFPELS